METQAGDTEELMVQFSLKAFCWQVPFCSKEVSSIQALTWLEKAYLHYTEESALPKIL